MSRPVSPTTALAAECSLGHPVSVGQLCVDELRASGFNEFDEEETKVTILEATGRQGPPGNHQAGVTLTKQGVHTPLERRVFDNDEALCSYLVQTEVPRIRIV